MKFKILALILLLTAFSSMADSQIFLVRHAEKQTVKPDPGLTKEGFARAERLARLLANSKIDTIYSTDYKRTRETAQPLADKLGIKVTFYDPRDLASFAKKLKQQEGNFLVVGHSNTTPVLANLLSGETVKPIPETEYHHLFLVTLQDEKARLLELSTD